MSFDPVALRKKIARRTYSDKYGCEMMGDVDYSHFAPKLTYCGQRPVKLIPEVGMFGAWMCDECVEAWLIRVDAE